MSVNGTNIKTVDFNTLNSEELKEFKEKYDAYILDIDETLINQNRNPIEGVEEALNEIAKNGKSIIVFTDNCFQPFEDTTEKINKIFPVIKKENIMGAGRLVVRYLKEINFKKKVYVIGSANGMVAELKNSGYDVVYDEKEKHMTLPELRQTELEDGVGAVVVAMDITLNFNKLFKSANYLMDPEVLFIQTHFLKFVSRNPTVPGAGASTAFLQTVTGRSVTIATGKGSEYCSKYLTSLGFPAERCIVIGDGLHSDVVAGNQAGMDSMLVLTGASTLKDVEEAKAKNLEDQIPTYYANSFADLIKAFKT